MEDMDRWAGLTDGEERLEEVYLRSELTGGVDRMEMEEHGIQICTDASFPIGSRHMDHLHLILGIAQTLQQCFRVIQRVFRCKLRYFFNIIYDFSIIQNYHHFI